jgi:hypothetical protein
MEHIVPYQNVLHGFVSYLPRCPLSCIIQVIEDIDSLVSYFQKLYREIGLVRVRLVPLSLLCKVVGLGIL